MNLTIFSYCIHTLFTNTTHNFHYYIRNTTQLQEIPLIIISWPSGLNSVKSVQDIYNECGYPKYTLKNKTNDLVISEFSQSILTDYIGGSQAQDVMSKIRFQSDNPHLGGANNGDGTFTVFKNHEMYLEVILNNNVYDMTRGYQNITIKAED